MYCIPVTYGNRANEELFARGITTHKAAEQLRQAAIQRGYTDARVEREEDFQAAQRAKREGRANQAWAA